MKNICNALAISALLLGFASVTHAQVSVGVRIGPPPPPRAYKVPPQPGPDREWVEGHYTMRGSHYQWHNGAWARPPHPGAYWVEPYYAEGHYYAGRWEGGNTRADQHSQTRPRDEGQGNRR